MVTPESNVCPEAATMMADAATCSLEAAMQPPTTAFDFNSGVYVIADSAYAELPMASLEKLNGLMETGVSELVLVASPDTSDRTLSSLLASALNSVTPVTVARAPAQAPGVASSAGITVDTASLSSKQLADLIACLLKRMDGGSTGMALQPFTAPAGQSVASLPALRAGTLAAARFKNGNRVVTLVGYSKRE